MTTTTILTVISCNKNPNPPTAEINKIYQAVNNKNITVSDNQLWGNNPKWQSIVLNDIKNQLTSTNILSNTEIKLLWLNPDIKPLTVITNDNQETQKLNILIGHSQDKKTDIKTARINLTWALTSDQQPIYSIYKQIPKTIANLKGCFILYENNVWVGGNKNYGWGNNHKSKSSLYLNDDPLKTMFSNRSGINNPRQYHLSLPHIKVTVGESFIPLTNEIKIVNKNSFFDLYYLKSNPDFTTQIVTTIQIKYENDYDLVLNKLKKILDYLVYLYQS